jgi:hypothetical protein
MPSARRSLLDAAGGSASRPVLAPDLPRRRSPPIDRYERVEAHRLGASAAHDLFSNLDLTPTEFEAVNYRQHPALAEALVPTT